MVELRCIKCDKLLSKQITDNTIEIKCQRCGRTMQFEKECENEECTAEISAPFKISE